MNGRQGTSPGPCTFRSGNSMHASAISRPIAGSSSSAEAGRARRKSDDRSARVGLRRAQPHRGDAGVGSCRPAARAAQRPRCLSRVGRSAGVAVRSRDRLVARDDRRRRIDPRRPGARLHPRRAGQGGNHRLARDRGHHRARRRAGALAIRMRGLAYCDPVRARRRGGHARRHGTQPPRELDLDPLLFALVMLAAAWGMFRSRPGNDDDETLDAARVALSRLLPAGLIVGVLTGFFGVGGGFVIVPALVLLIGLPLRAAVGTSLAAIVIISAAALAAHINSATINWTIATSFTAAAIVGAVGEQRASPTASRPPDSTNSSPGSSSSWRYSYSPRTHPRSAHRNPMQGICMRPSVSARAVRPRMKRARRGKKAIYPEASLK